MDILKLIKTRATIRKYRMRRDWGVVHNFEQKHKKIFLTNLAVNDGLRIFRDLYQFAKKINSRLYYKNLYLRKVDALSKVHRMFMKVKP